MNKKDVLELKRRLKKEYCTFTRMCGCYVDIDGTKITKIEETFLNSTSILTLRKKCCLAALETIF